jgi:4-amino-4-deoxy-L-arabinose transferase-like glycosyltransferase
MAPELFRDLVFGQHLGRVVEGSRHGGPPWKNLVRMPLLLLPWTLPILLGLGDAWRSWSAHRRRRSCDAGLVRAGLWLLVLFAFFSAIPSKRDLYLLPAYPAAALLAARAIGSRLAGAGMPQVVATFPVTLFALAGVTCASLAFVPLGPEGFVLPGRAWRALLLAAVSLIGAASIARSSHRTRWREWGRRILVTWTAWSTLVVLLVFPHVDPLKSARLLAQDLASRPERPRTIPCRGVRAEGYRFYGGGPAVNDRELEAALARDGADFLALVREEEWQDLPPADQARFTILCSRRVGSRLIHVLGAAPQAAPPQ